MKPRHANFWHDLFARGSAEHFLSAVPHANILLAVILVLLGLILLLLAPRIYRWIIAMDVIALGWVLAMMVAPQSMPIALVVVVGAVIVAVAIVPMLEMAFALVGAVAGCFMGMAVGQWMHSPPGAQWMAAILGLVACGIIAFFVFRAALIFGFTLQGAAMLISGLLVLLRAAGPVSWKQWALHTPLLKPTGLLLLTLGVACAGTLWQQWQKPAKDGDGKQ